MAAAAATLSPEPRGPIQHNQSELPPTSISETTNELYNAPANSVTPEQYSGEGEDDAPRSPVRKLHKKTGSLRMNGHKRDREGSSSQLMIEKFQDRDGEHLTTIKQYRPFGGTETQTRRSDELVSGRRVGTKWERSQYAHCCYQLYPNCLTLLIHLLIQRPFCTALSASPAASSNLDSARSHFVHRLLPDLFLPSGRYPSDLATPPSISSIHSVFQCRHLGHTLAPL